MTRLNKGGTTPRPMPLKTEKVSSGTTHEGAPGFARDAKTELFLRATTVFAGEGQFYEKAEVADKRAVELVRQLAVEDWKWVAGFLPWLRSQGNIRTSAIMLAVEAAKATAGKTFEQHFKNPSPYYESLTPRQLINAVLQRPDEPAEALAYYKDTYGKTPAGGINRGIADAAVRLYAQDAVVRWDKPDRMRFADVIELAHPEGKTLEQDALFRYLLDERHHPSGEIPFAGPIRWRRELSLLTPQQRHAWAAHTLDHPDEDDPMASKLRGAAAGQWEWVMSWLGEGAKGAEDWSPLTERQRWELIIPTMGYMALLRNLRNFEEAGVKPATVKWVCEKISDPKRVARSRQFPYRFLSAHLNTNGAQWLPALETALTYSTGNIPSLDGLTHILVDCSGSMTWGTSQARGRDTSVRPTRAQMALLFAAALAARNPGKAEIYLFANQAYGPIFLHAGASVLRVMEELSRQGNLLGGGTELEKSIRLTFDPAKHTRSVILTDEQAHWGGAREVTQSIPERVPTYLFNLAGLTHGATPYGKNRVGLGGLTDASFGIMQRYEASRTGLWPWQYDVAQASPDDE